MNKIASLSAPMPCEGNVCSVFLADSPFDSLYSEGAEPWLTARRRCDCTGYCASMSAVLF